MAGFGHYPFGHQPFGGGLETLTPGTLSLTLSTLAGVVASAGVSGPVSLTLSIPASATGVTTSDAGPVTGALTLLAPEVTSYSTTLMPPGLAGVLSLLAPAVFSYTDTVTLVPVPVSLTLGTLPAAAVSVFNTTLQPGALPLALSTLLLALPVTVGHMLVTPLTGALSVQGSAQSVLANVVSPAPLIRVLVSGGVDLSQPLILTPQPVTLAASILQDAAGGGYFVFSGLSFMVGGVRVFTPWTVGVGRVTGQWDTVTRVGELWAVSTRSQ